MTFIGSPNYTSGREGQRVEGIIVHWMAGTLAATDSVFQDTNRQTSAHYGVENNVVHQYVAEENTAYHAGNWGVNLRTIGIEHSAAPDRYATTETYDTSARIIAEAAKRWGFPINANTIRPHRAIIATQCPGTIDLNRLITKANELIGGDEVIKAEDRDLVRIINSEVKGYDFVKTHRGDYDAAEMKAWTGQPWTKLIGEGWAQSEAFRAKRNAAMAGLEPVTEQLYRKKV